MIEIDSLPRALTEAFLSVGELGPAWGKLLRVLSPITGREVRFALGTMERWYYRGRRERDDPVSVPRRSPRKDRGRVSLPPVLAKQLTEQHLRHPHWSYQLHYDHLAAQVQADPSLGPLRSYCTVRR